MYNYLAQEPLNKLKGELKYRKNVDGEYTVKIEKVEKVES